MNKWKLNNKGMTMVEIMTALVIVTILMSVLGYIFLSSMNYMTYFGGKRNMKLMLDTMMQQVQDNISLAAEICIKDEEGIPEDWDMDQTSYICFEPATDGGIVSAPGIDTFYDSSLYDGGSLVSRVKYDNAVIGEQGDSDLKRNLSIVLEFYDDQGVLVYQRERTLDVVNLSYFKEDIKAKANHAEITANTEINNENKKLYIYYALERQTTYGERDICKIFQEIFDTFTNENINFYKNSTLVNKKLNVEGKANGNVGPVCNAHGVLMWQFRAMPYKVLPNQDWNSAGVTTSNREEALLPISKERLTKWGITSMIGLQTTNTSFYMEPYHYVQNTEKLDILYYVYNSTYFDNLLSGYPRITQLIYNNEEDKWYYLPIGTEGAVCTGIYVGDKVADAKKQKGLPFDYGTTITYTTKVGEIENTYTTTIHSSYQIKLFFKKYGTPLIYK